MSFKGNRLLNKVIRSHQKHEVNIYELQKFLKDKIDFEFAIEYQPADGHMILDVESGFNIAPIASCLSIIYAKGHLSQEEHEKLCI